MLMGMSTETVNPVRMSRAIAHAVLHDLSGSQGRAAEPLATSSFLRLIDMYRRNSFEDERHLGVLEKDNFQDLNVGHVSDLYERLRKILDETIRQFDNDDPMQFATHIYDLLAPYAKNGRSTLTGPDLAQLTEFLKKLTASLKNA